MDSDTKDYVLNEIAELRNELSDELKELNKKIIKLHSELEVHRCNLDAHKE